MKLIEPIQIHVGEQEVQELKHWSCHCGARGLAVIFKGIPAPDVDECPKCKCDIPVSTDTPANQQPPSLFNQL